MGTKANGIDVSNWQGKVAWDSTGVDFGFAKITEGIHYVDPDGKSNIEGMIANKILTGGYHFARPAAGNAKAQADFFTQNVDTSKLDMIALDMEDAGGLSFTNLQTWVNEWFAEFPPTYTGLRVLYMDLNYASKIQCPKGVHLWIATRGQAVPNGMDYLFQQTGQSTVPGVNGNVDVDVANVSRETLASMVNPVQVPTKPVPKDGETEYTVVEGDTLEHIAKVHNVALDVLEKANPQITDPSVIKPGEVINIPAVHLQNNPSPQSETYVTVSNEIVDGNKKPNNSLWNIAFNTSGDGSHWHYLIKLNPGVMPRQLVLGEKIRIK